MKRISVRLSSFLLVTFLGATTAQVDGIHSGSPMVRLCSALQVVHEGEHVPIQVRGVLQDSYFYDPGEPVCPTDVQPATLLVLETPLPQEAAEWLERDGRVILTVEGTLFGPAPPAESSKERPVALRIADKMKARYGFHHSFRTKLVVTSITSYERVPSALPWEAVLVRPRRNSSVPKLRCADLPTFPWQARRLGVEGSVVLEMEIISGVVHAARIVQADDPILGSAALENVLSWRFEDDVSTTLSTTFLFQLERRTFSADDNSVVEARLPAFVRIVGPRLDW